MRARSGDDVDESKCDSAMEAMERELAGWPRARIPIRARSPP